MKRLLLPTILHLVIVHLSAYADSLGTIPQDLLSPAATDGQPAPGKRVRQVLPDYLCSDVYHLLYLPTDWEPGRKYPVIVEYAGNQWRTSPGTVEGCNLGYGISGGKGVIWICMPSVDTKAMKNAPWWWGDIKATVNYCVATVECTLQCYGGDPEKVFIAGFSRGSIACNYIGLHNEEIASLWRGFICQSHYDGVQLWSYADSDRDAAAKRLQRLGNRPQFISDAQSVDNTRNFLQQAYPGGNFTFLSLPFSEHTDTWVLRDIPARKTLRDWFKKTINQ